MKKCFLMLLICCAVLFGAESPKYVFLFIGDGMSVPQRVLADKAGNVYIVLGNITTGAAMFSPDGVFTGF